MKHDNILLLGRARIHQHAWRQGPLAPLASERRITRRARLTGHLARALCIASVVTFAIIGAACTAVHIGAWLNAGAGL